MKKSQGKKKKSSSKVVTTVDVVEAGGGGTPSAHFVRGPRSDAEFGTDALLAHMHGIPLSTPDQHRLARMRQKHGDAADRSEARFVNLKKEMPCERCKD